MASGKQKPKLGDEYISFIDTSMPHRAGVYVVDHFMTNDPKTPTGKCRILLVNISTDEVHRAGYLSAPLGFRAYYVNDYELVATCIIPSTTFDPPVEVFQRIGRMYYAPWTRK